MDAPTMRAALVDHLMDMHPNPTDGLTREQIANTAEHVPARVLEMCSGDLEVAAWVKMAVALWALCEREMEDEMVRKLPTGNA